MPEQSSTTGERIRAVRQRANLSQERFATELGYSKRALINWEQGAAEPPMAILPKLRELFDVDPEWLVMGTDFMPRSFFKQVDWKRLERIERDVKHACRDVGVDLSEDQRKNLVQAFYDDGPAADAENKKHLRKILRQLVRER